MLQDDLLLLWTQGDDDALPGDELGLRLQLRMLADDVRPAVPGQCVGIGDDRPPVVHGEVALPGWHHGSLRFEGFDQAALADAPDPEVIRHLRHHLPIGEIGRFE